METTVKTTSGAVRGTELGTGVITSAASPTPRRRLDRCGSGPPNGRRHGTASASDRSR